MILNLESVSDDEDVRVQWPPAVREEPDYPELDWRPIDLASDTVQAAPAVHLRLVKG